MRPLVSLYLIFSKASLSSFYSRQGGTPRLQSYQLIQSGDGALFRWEVMHKILKGYSFISFDFKKAALLKYNLHIIKFHPFKICNTIFSKFTEFQPFTTTVLENFCDPKKIDQRMNRHLYVLGEKNHFKVSMLRFKIPWFNQLFQLINPIRSQWHRTREYGASINSSAAPTGKPLCFR